MVKLSNFNTVIETMFDSIMIPIVKINSEHIITSANSTFQTMTNYKLDEIINNPFYILIGKEEYKKFNKYYNKTIKNPPKSLFVKLPSTLIGNNMEKISIEIIIPIIDAFKDHKYLIISTNKFQDHSLEKLKYMAYYDQLTAIPNRILFFDRAITALKLAKRERKMVGILYVDIDDFKSINDELGHDIGDLLLKDISNRLKSCIRDSDTVARLGGDEFAIIMINISNKNDIKILAKRILRKNKESLKINKNKISPKTSIGISIYPKDGKNIEELLKCADIAMYASKEQSYNNYSFFNESNKN